MPVTITYGIPDFVLGTILLLVIVVVLAIVALKLGSTALAGVIDGDARIMGLLLLPVTLLVAGIDVVIAFWMFVPMLQQTLKLM